MQTQRRQEKVYDLSNLRVLIVEDSHFIADLMASSLHEMGIGTVKVVNNGFKAKEKILSHNAVSSSANIDTVILDWLMPEMTGLELLKWIRDHRSDAIRFLPVIICSAFATSIIVEQGRDSGATETMVKPVSAEKIAGRIQHMIENQRPFIKTSDFFGPDRRRKIVRYKTPAPDRRTMKSEEIRRHVEKLE